jgi:hypothetical protein
MTIPLSYYYYLQPTLAARCVTGDMPRHVVTDLKSHSHPIVSQERFGNGVGEKSSRALKSTRARKNIAR